MNRDQMINHLILQGWSTGRGLWGVKRVWRLPVMYLWRKNEDAWYCVRRLNEQTLADSRNKPMSWNTWTAGQLKSLLELMRQNGHDQAAP